MKILVTGATGFVGSNIIQHLKEHDLRSLSLRYQPQQVINLLDVDAVLHLAGKAHDLKNISGPEDYYEANFELTRQVYDAFLQSQAQVFIFMSSVKAAADQVAGILTEDIPPQPKTHYGISKLQAEQYILSQPRPENKRVYILRPSMIHGPGNKGNLNLLYKVVSKNVPWPLGAFQNKRSFLSIDNLIFVIPQLLERPNIPSGIYNLSDDQPVSTNELIQLIGSSLNRKISIWNIPSSWIYLLARLGDILHLPLNSERLTKLTENYVVSNQKIVGALGLEFPVTASEGLRKTLKSFN